MQKSLDASAFLDFKGWEFFRNIIFSNEIINGLSLEKLNNFNIEDNFVTICNNYIENKNYRVNKLFFNKIQLGVISKGYEYTTSMLIKVFENKFKEFRNQICELIENNTFTVSYFSKEYYKLNNKLNNLKFLLSYIDYSYKNKDGKKSDYSFVILVKNYVGYNIIINSKYNKDNKEYYLHELFINEIEQNFNTETILQIFKIYDFYNKFSYVVKNQKDKNGMDYFNLESKNLNFSEDTKNKFITRVIEILNKKILDLTKNSNTSIEQNERDIKYIRNLINISPEFSNSNIFMVLYKRALTERLRQESNPDIESELLKSLNPQSDIDLYIKMKNQINDIKLSKQHNTIYRKITVGHCSEKYKDIDISKFNRENCNIKVCRSYDWDYVDNEFENYNIPINLSIYLDIFNAYHKDRFNERQLGWMYDECFGVVGFNTDKPYNVRMNLLQLAVFYSLNESPKSALELSNNLKINLQKLGIVLNSLLLSKIIHRSYGSSDNPNIIFNVNEEFSYNENDLSIVSIYNKIKKMSETKDIKPDDTINLPSETVLRAKILANIISERIIDKDKLIDNINNYFKINIPSRYLDNVIKDIIDSNIRINLCHNTLFFKNNDLDSSEELDDDNDLEKSHDDEYHIAEVD